MWALFGKNVCKNERIGSRLGGTPLDPPMLMDKEFGPTITEQIQPIMNILWHLNAWPAESSHKMDLGPTQLRENERT